jgi:hypothetical protein
MHFSCGSNTEGEVGTLDLSKGNIVLRLVPQKIVGLSLYLNYEAFKIISETY